MKKKKESAIVLSEIDILRDVYLKSHAARRLQEKKKQEKEGTINVNLPKSIFTDCFVNEEDCNVKFNWENTASVSPSLVEEDMKYLDSIMDGAFENEMNLNDTHSRILIPACVVNETVNMDDKDAIDVLFEQATFVTNDAYDFKFDCEL